MAAQRQLAAVPPPPPPPLVTLPLRATFLAASDCCASSSSSWSTRDAIGCERPVEVGPPPPQKLHPPMPLKLLGAVSSLGVSAACGWVVRPPPRDDLEGDRGDRGDEAHGEVRLRSRVERANRRGMAWGTRQWHDASCGGGGLSCGATPRAEPRGGRPAHARDGTRPKRNELRMLVKLEVGGVVLAMVRLLR